MNKIAKAELAPHQKAFEDNENSEASDRMANRSPESRERMAARTAEIPLEITPAKQREALNVSQTQLAATLDVSQPSPVKRVKCESGLKRLTQKRMFSPLSAGFRLVLVND